MSREELISLINSLGGSAPEGATDEELWNLYMQLVGQQDQQPVEATTPLPATDPAAFQMFAQETSQEDLFGNLETYLADVERDTRDAEIASHIEWLDANPNMADLPIPGAPSLQEIDEYRQRSGTATTPVADAPEAFDYWSYVFSEENLRRTVNDTFGQFSSGTTQALHLPMQAAGMYGLLASPIEAMSGADLGGNAALNYAADQRASIQDLWGVSDPQGVIPSIFELAGMAVPVPGTRAPTGFVGNLAELATPLTIGATPGRVAANIGVGFVMDQTLKELLEQEGYEQETIYDALGVSEAMRGAAEPINPFILPVFGGLAAASIASPIAVSLIHNMRTPVPTVVNVRDVDWDGPENLQTIETAGDVLKSTSVDTVETMHDILGRAGVPDTDIAHRMLDQDTHIAAITRTNEAMSSGVLNTQYGTFTTPVAPKLLHDAYNQFTPMQQQNIDLYLKLGDTMDDLQLQVQRGVGPTNAAAQLAQVRAQRAQMRTAFPEVGAYSADVQRLTESVRDFLGQGPYAMLSPQGLQALGVERKHYIPMDPLQIDPNQPLLARVNDAMQQNDGQSMDAWFLQQRNLTAQSSPNNRQPAIETLIGYTEAAIRAQMRNNTQNAIIDALKNSQYGSGTIRVATADEVAKFPDRIVSVYRNGEKVNYITTRLQRALLQFDPYVLNNPVSLGLYGMKRGLEQTTTGVLTTLTGGFFAGTTMIRDTLAGMALNPREHAANPLQVLYAIPEVASLQLRKSLADAIHARIAANEPIPFMSQQGAQVLADRMAQQYYNSFYHVAREQGGISANLMTSRIKTAQGVMNEVAESLRPLWNNPVMRASSIGLRGIHNIFELVSDAPRIAAFKKMWEAGMDPADAAMTTRTLTGDTGRSGQLRLADGTVITGDMINKQLGPFVRILGGAAEFGRTAIPWFNPTVQGLKKLSDAFSTRPVETAIQSWATVGLPGLAVYGWNQWLSSQSEEGFDYNQYMMEQRTGRDIAMELYIALPGRRPEEGITIPLPHELAFFMSPWQVALHNMRGTDEEITKAMTYSGLQILENAAGLPLPPIVGAMFAAAGQNSPSSITDLFAGTYKKRENEASVLPTNIENAMRALWGSSLGTVVDVINATVGGGISAGMEEYAHNLIRKLPVIKGPTGNKTNVTAFTQMNSEMFEQLAAADRFQAIYDTHFHPDSTGMARGSNLPAGPAGNTFEISRADAGPATTPVPTNPLFALYGDYLRTAFASNAQGMTNASARYGVLTAQINQLKTFNAGRRVDFEAYQDMVMNAPERIAEIQARIDEANASIAEAQTTYDALPRGTKTGSPEQATLQAAKDALKPINEELKKEQEIDKIRQLLEQNEIDLSNRYDVNRLISILENERYLTAQERLTIIRDAEQYVTEQLRQEGLLPPGQTFRIERDLGLTAPDWMPPQQPTQPAGVPQPIQ